MPRRPHVLHRANAPFAVLFVAGAAIVAGALLAPAFPGPILLMAGLAASVGMALVAVTGMPRGRRAGWHLLGMGSTILSIALATRAFGADPISDPIASVLIAAGGIPILLGALSLIRPQGHEADAALYVDAILLAVIVAMISWYGIVQPTFHASGSGAGYLDAILSTAWLTADSAFLIIGAYTAWTQRGTTVAQAALLGALLASSVTDLGVFQAYTGVGYTPGQWTDLATFIVPAILAAAAWHPSAKAPTHLRRRLRDPRVLNFRLIVVTGSLAIVPVALLLYGVLQGGDGGELASPPGMPSIEAQLGGQMLVVVVLVTIRLVLAVARLEGVLRARDGLEVELKRQATVDGLTSLANRSVFTSRLELALARSEASTVAVLFCDLDDFKTVNDTLGHAAGDELLATVAARLAASVRPTDLAARLGGDEFAVLLTGVEHPAAAEAVAQRILDSFTTPVTVAGTVVPVRISIGVALGGDVATAAELMRDADIAMYLAKGGGKGRFERFNPEMRSRVAERMALQTDLGLALERDELALVYQPISSLGADGVIGGEGVIGTEALLRWHHPTRGLVGPSDFIPLAEQCGLIHPIGRWVLATAARQVRQWLDQGASPDIHVSVNVSAVQLSAAGFAQDVDAIVRAAGISPRHVMLELTESALVDADTASVVLTHLKRLGFRIAIDDFGTGYSAMSYLASFPIDVLKIDRSFVTRMAADEQGRSLVKTILGLARNLDLETIAEGIEEAEQLRELTRMGCRFGQGYLLGRPVEPAEIGLLLGAVVPRAVPRRVAAGTAA
jgi:diguanylate cyclase (GGDEF)-like protein